MKSPFKLAWLTGVLLTWPAAPGMALASSPYAAQIVGAQGPFGAPPYGDTNAVLGIPATRFYDPSGGFSGGATNRRVKLVEPAFNISGSTNNPFTTNLLLTMGNGSHVIARFDHPVYDHPANPYGLELLVFGNSFYGSTGPVNDGANMNTIMLTGGYFAEPTKVSVSPGYTGQPGEDPNDPNTWPWYRYDAGPYGDTAFPTHAFKWNRAGADWTDELMDFTKPVNPSLNTLLDSGGISAADAIDLYVGSGGGTGFDLQPSGFPWIQYVKVEGIDPGFNDGDIDAFSIVRPMTVGDELSIAPGNLTNNTAKLVFQEAGQTNRDRITLAFTAVSDVAKVTTATVTNPAVLASLTGTPLNAVQLDLSPILGTDPVMFQAGLTLATSDSYNGNGADLLVLKWTGAEWATESFGFVATNRTVVVTNVTSLSAFAVTQLVPPQLSISPGTNSFVLQFTPLANWSNTLERSTNLINWTALVTFTPTNAQPVSFDDGTAPAGRAFYRVKAVKP